MFKPNFYMQNLLGSAGMIREQQKHLAVRLSLLTHDLVARQHGTGKNSLFRHAFHDFGI